MSNLLTKADIVAIRDADDICIHLTKNNPEGLVRLIKRAPYGVPFAQDKVWELSADVTIGGYHASSSKEGVKTGTVSCFDMVGIHHNQYHHVSSVLKTLRVGDEIEFRFLPDWHSNGYLARGGLHADVLELVIRRKSGSNHTKRHSFILAESICPDNTARMCRGVEPTPDWLAAKDRECA